MVEPTVCISERIPVNINYSLVSVSTLDNGQFVVYPNPVNNTLSLSFTKGFSANAASVYDITGRKVSSFSFDKNASFQQMDVSALTAGIYSLKVEGSNAVRFVKE